MRHLSLIVLLGLIVGSSGLAAEAPTTDPRSLRINTEMGFLILSRDFNAQVRRAVEDDFSNANAWRLELQDDGRGRGVSADRRLDAQPAASSLQRLENGFLSHLPIEGEL